MLVNQLRKGLPFYTNYVLSNSPRHPVIQALHTWAKCKNFNWPGNSMVEKRKNDTVETIVNLVSFLIALVYLNNSREPR